MTTAASRALAAGTMSLRNALRRGGHRHRQGALDRPDAAVQGQLADDGEVAQLFGQQLAGGDQQAQRDRQIEAAGVFAEVGRSEIDDGAAGMPGVAEIGQGALDAMNALLDRHLGQADEDRLGQPGRDIDFDLDGNGVDADEGEGVQLGEHGRLRNGLRFDGYRESSFHCCNRRPHRPQLSSVACPNLGERQRV